MATKLKLGMIGLTAERGWASTAHIPAIRALYDDIELVGVANRARASAEAAVRAFGMGRAFDNADSLISCPEIDDIVVAVKVRHHRDLVARSLGAGKHVYCEWPLAVDLSEAKELAALAHQQQVVAVIGTQAVVSPEIRFLRQLIDDRYLGDLRSATFLGSGNTWGDDIAAGDAYAMDPKNGATLLSVMGGHAFSALQHVLGPISSIKGYLTQRQCSARVEETGETVPMLTPDQMVTAGEFASGVPFAFQLRGGLPCGTRLFWEIGGSKHDLRITPRSGEPPLVNISVLKIESCERGDSSYQELQVPETFMSHPNAINGPARNVYNLYRRFIRDVREGGKSTPSFDDAVSLHELIDGFAAQ